MNTFILMVVILTTSIPQIGLSPEEAEIVLKNSSPIPFAATTIAGCSDPAKKAQLLNLYNKQLQAIISLGKAGIHSDPDVLIPYLNYAIDDSAFAMPPQIGKREDLLATRKAWPAFAALLDIPNSALALESYSINKRNPRDLRISSLLVLRYVDKDRFKTTSENLNREFANSDTGIRNYLEAITNGTAVFWGVLPLNLNH